MIWRFRGGTMDMSLPRVMGALNVTPDSFFADSRHLEAASAADAAGRMVQYGADMIDMGAQSTRPGAVPVSAEEEWARLQAPLKAVLDTVSVPISVDTFFPDVARRALDMGAAVINDVSGSEQNGMASVAAAYGAGLICMRPGDPKCRNAAPDAVMAQTHAYFARVLALASAAGLPAENVCLDPGIGFGSSTAADTALIARLPELAAAFPHNPLLVGASRKRLIAELTADLAGTDPLTGTVALHTLALFGGAHMVRVHDVGEAKAAATIVAAVRDFI